MYLDLPICELLVLLFVLRILLNFVKSVHMLSGKMLNWAGLLKLAGRGLEGLAFHPVIPRHVSEVRSG